MQTKIILAMAAAIMVVAALAAIATVQFVGAQNQATVPNPTLIQLPNGQYVYSGSAPLNVNGTLIYPCYPYGVNPNGAQNPQVTQQAPVPSYGYGYGGRGMCGRFW